MIPPAPKSAALRMRMTASRISPGWTGDSIRWFSKPPQKTMRPRRARRHLEKLFQRPLGVDRVDPDLDHVAQQIVQRSVETKKSKLVAVMQNLAKIAKKRPNKRPPEAQASGGSGRPGEVVFQDYGIDFRLCPALGFQAKEIAESAEQVAQLDIAFRQFAEGRFRAAQLAQPLKRPQLGMAQCEEPGVRTCRVDLGESGRVQQLCGRTKVRHRQRTSQRRTR